MSTYPPTTCGIATFSAALTRALSAADVESRIVRLVEQPAPPTDSPEVVAHVEVGAPNGHEVASQHLRHVDAVILQHEYGIYGGTDGRQVLDLLDACPAPTILVAHTVLSDPTAGQRLVLSTACRLADAVVAMGTVAADRLQDVYDVDPCRISVIPHGVTPATHTVGTGGTSIHDLVAPDVPVLLTWGLLGPGKGIEWAIDATAMLHDLRPAPVYVVAGRTHPKVQQRYGETYYDSLEGRAESLGIADRVVFEHRYHETSTLQWLLHRAAVVVLPYDSTEQVTSGVLVDAMAAGKPVVATRFPHAAELLADDAGLLVDHRDANALADAIRRLLTNPKLLADTGEAARSVAERFHWSSVARCYLDLAAQLQSR